MVTAHVHSVVVVLKGNSQFEIECNVVFSNIKVKKNKRTNKQTHAHANKYIWEKMGE